MIVCKYNVYRNQNTTLFLPKSSQILSVQEQDHELQCWVLQPDSWGVLEDYIVAVYGTGISMRHGGHLIPINTCIDQHGLVWHSFLHIDKMM